MAWSLTSLIDAPALPLYGAFAVGILVGMEILARAIPLVFESSSVKRIEERGKHLDQLEAIDIRYITINKIITVIFMYHVLYVCFNTPTIKLYANELTVQNTLGSLVVFYLFYDLIYSPSTDCYMSGRCMLSFTSTTTGKRLQVVAIWMPSMYILLSSPSGSICIC
jgi:uncharacterized membrane protein